MFLLQKRAVRIIFGANRLAHTEPIFKSLKLLNIHKLYRYNIGLMMYKYHHKKLPHIFDDYFTMNSDVHVYSTRQSHLLHTPKYSTELRKRSFKCKAVSVWNDIHKALKSVNIAIGTFKDHLKKYLLSL